MNSEETILECMIACGWGVEDARKTIGELKQEAVEADNAFRQQVNNLNNSVDSAVKSLEQVLYDLRNA